MARDILLTGGTGQVGTELLQLDWPEGIRLIAPQRGELDLADAARAQSFVQERDWAAVINCAAFTAVDRAESDVFTAWQLNAMLPAALASASSRAGIPLVQISTDYVFDGMKRTPYEVTDSTGPLGVYGASKLGGELAVRMANPRHAILRTSWVVSPRGTNFLRTMLRLGAERTRLRIVDDQHGRPTSAADLALAIRTIALRLIDDANAPTGTFHFANEGATTWCGLAREIFRQVEALGQVVPTVEPIGTADYPTPARRPAWSVLSTDALTQAFCVAPRPWQDAVGDCIARLLAR
jgi:dTDP-4-dehydrorhamnose reductase